MSDRKTGIAHVQLVKRCGMLVAAFCHVLRFFPYLIVSVRQETNDGGRGGAAELIANNLGLFGIRIDVCDNGIGRSKVNSYCKSHG